MLNALQGFFGWAIYGIPAFIFLITTVVFFHELGHFSVARFFGVRVETFSIGFGRGMVKWTDKKGTLWKIGWIPLGGFVKFFGDADGASTPDREGVAAMTPAERAVAFPFKPVWQRALIVVAGPVANFILAFVMLAGLMMIHGRVVIPPVVGKIAPHSPAQIAGLHMGDRIVSIDGSAVSTFGEIEQIVSLSANQRLPIMLDRGASRLTLWATPHEITITDPFKNKQRIGDLGFNPPGPPLIESVSPGTPAQRAGIRPGDRFVSVNGQSVIDTEDVRNIVSTHAGRDLVLVMSRGGKPVTLHATPIRNDQKEGILGISFVAQGTLQRLGPLEAAGAAVGAVEDIMSLTFRSREQLFRGNTSQLSGPIGILKISGQVASVSFLWLIQLAALISVSIGLVNLFPIPLLDGGHLLYYAFEGVLGRPLGERAQDVGFRLGLAVVLGIFLLATWNDLVRLNLF
ncbi:MAG TPA: RIP metalloprotease RseP [Rhizomicrobium sp.]|jgi:regulator of sigma E protease|nr:RIP metalloprotease RseP [Rhizomicrobium sp.]